MNPDQTLIHAKALIDGQSDTNGLNVTLVASGKFADLVAVPGDPLADIPLMTKSAS